MLVDKQFNIDLIVIDEVSMLKARTLFAVNEQLQSLRGSPRDFGGILIILFCGDLHQFRPVQERPMLLPNAMTSSDDNASFRIEQRHEHDVAHALWKKFPTVVMLNKQVRAAGDFALQGPTDVRSLELTNNPSILVSSSYCVWHHWLMVVAMSCTPCLFKSVKASTFGHKGAKCNTNHKMPL